MENQILDDGLTPNIANLIPASKGKRFANFLIDYIILLLLLIGVFAVFIAAGILTPDENGEVGLIGDLMAIIAYPIYYILTEGLLNGKSVGKYITGTRAIVINGEQMSSGTVLKRSFSRIVPFEAFSFFGSDPGGWHDSWTDTMVIDEKKSILPNDIDLDLVE